MKEQNQLRRLAVECWLSAKETKQGGLRRPQPLISCGLVSICPGVTAHTLCIPWSPNSLHFPQGLGGRGRAWAMRAAFVRLQCPLQAEACQHTTERATKGSGLGEPSRDPGL